MAEKDRNNFHKIPYDSEPIYRQATYKKSARVSQGEKAKSNNSFLAVIICAFLIVFNIILSALMISLIRDNRGAVSNNDITITPGSGFDASAVVSKAKPSAVLVNADAISGAVVDEKSFLAMRMSGAGVILSDNKEEGTAYILTCYHVVVGHTDEIYIMLFDSYTPIAATMEAYSRTYDIALLKIDKSAVYRNSKALPAETANSSYVSEGDRVVAIGNPLGRGFSVTQGSISMINDTVNVSGNTMRAFRTDAAINEGNSGGGLFDSYGRLIGIVNAKSGDASVDDVGFAIHGNVVVNLANNMLRNTRPTQANIGASFVATGSYIDELGGKLISIENVFISSVEQGSAAAKAGFIGDGSEQILGFYVGQTYVQMVNRYTFDEYSFNFERGDEVVFKVRKGGRETDYTVTIDKIVSVLG